MNTEQLIKRISEHVNAFGIRPSEIRMHDLDIWRLERELMRDAQYVDSIEREDHVILNESSKIQRGWRLTFLGVDVYSDSTVEVGTARLKP